MLWTAPGVKLPSYRKNGFNPSLWRCDFLHVDVVGTFFVLRPVVGETLEVTVVKKGVGHLDALLHDVFSVLVYGDNLEKKDIKLGDSVLVKVVSFSC